MPEADTVSTDEALDAAPAPTWTCACICGCRKSISVGAGWCNDCASQYWEQGPQSGHNIGSAADEWRRRNE